MQHKNFLPSDTLKPYVKYYWTCTTDKDVALEVMYPSGYVELSIEISNGNTVRQFGDRSVKIPSLEVLGHFNIPTRATVTKGTAHLITRFYPYASSLFFPDHISNFTNDSIDLSDILRKESTEFYNRLMEQNSIDRKIKTLEAFLIQRLVRNEKNHKTLKLVEQICNHVYRDGESFNMVNLASHYGFSERYIQKLFLDWVGLSPKSFFSIQRFNKSLELVRSSAAPLTSVALECGYYDQAHFIKEFKSYTGLTPSQVVRLHEAQI